MSAWIALRWGVTIVLSLLWSIIAIANGSLAWRTWVRKEERAPSPLPLVGGFVAMLAARICPSDSALVPLFFWLALILDVGSLPYLVLTLVALQTEARREKHFWKRTYVGSSWPVKLAVGVLCWLVFLVVIDSLGGVHTLDETSRLIAMLAATAIYWVLYIFVHVRLKKYSVIRRGG